MIDQRYPTYGWGSLLLDKNIKEWFFEGMTDAVYKEDLLYPVLANVREMTSLNDVVATFTGGQLYGQHDHMEKARTYEPGSGWQIRMNPLLFKNSFVVPGSITQWSQYTMFIQTQMRMLGAYGLITLDYVFVNMLNNAFNAAFPIYDGEPLASTSHVLKNAPGVFANRPATGSPISQESLAEAYEYFMAMPNDDGIKFGMRPQFLVVPVSQAIKAAQILNQTLDPSINNNGTPALATGYSKFGSPTLIVSSKLTNPNAWFLVAGKSQVSGNGHGLDLYFTPRGYPGTESIPRKDPDHEKHIGKFEVAPTIMKARGIWANPGS